MGAVIFICVLFLSAYWEADIRWLPEASHFLMGLCFGYMRRRSRSIYPGMLLHACWNALVVLQELTA